MAFFEQSRLHHRLFTAIQRSRWNAITLTFFRFNVNLSNLVFKLQLVENTTATILPFRLPRFTSVNWAIKSDQWITTTGTHSVLVHQNEQQLAQWMKRYANRGHAFTKEFIQSYCVYWHVVVRVSIDTNSAALKKQAILANISMNFHLY